MEDQFNTADGGSSVALTLKIVDVTAHSLHIGVLADVIRRCAEEKLKIIKIV